MCVPRKYNWERYVMRASLMYAFRRAFSLPYKMATFISIKGLFEMATHLLNMYMYLQEAGVKGEPQYNYLHMQYVHYL